jgi:salicylate hydroxylase
MNVAIIGAGIAGPALACHLRKCFPSGTVTLFESAPAIKEVGAGISLAPNGMKTLRQIGIADLAEATGEVVGGVPGPADTCQVTGLEEPQ